MTTSEARFRLWDRDVLDLALPAVGSALVPFIHRSVDMAFCSQLGTDAVAAFSVGSLAIWMYHAVGALIAIGLTALVSRYAGAGRVDGARYVGGQGLRWSAALGAVAGVLGIALAPTLFGITAAESDVARQGIPYVRIYWAAGPFVMLVFAGDAIFRGQGNTRTPMRIAVIGLLVNIALDPLLIFGLGPIPGFGVAGASWATVIALAVAALLHLHALRSAGHLKWTRPTDAELALRSTTKLGKPALLGLDGAVFLRMVRVGVPVAVMGVLFNLIYLVILRCAEEAGGAPAQAGLGVGHTGEALAFVIGMGWAAAAAALVGRALGADDPDLAERQAWTATAQCAIVVGVWGVVLFLFDYEVASVFVQEAEARGHGADYIRVVAWCLIPQAAEQVLAGAFGGAGMTIPPTVVGVAIALLRIPLAYYMAFDLDMGPMGIWVAIALTAAIRGIVIAAWFSRGTWKTQDV